MHLKKLVIGYWLQKRRSLNRGGVIRQDKALMVSLTLLITFTPLSTLRPRECLVLS